MSALHLTFRRCKVGFLENKDKSEELDDSKLCSLVEGVGHQKILNMS